MDNANNYAANSPYNKDELKFFTVKKAMGDAKELDCNMLLQSIEQYAEQRRCEIRSTKTEFVISGAGYYVSNDGDDNNDGRSPKTAWKTIQAVVDHRDDFQKVMRCCLNAAACTAVIF